MACLGYDRQRIFVNSFTSEEPGAAPVAARYRREASTSTNSGDEGTAIVGIRRAGSKPPPPARTRVADAAARRLGSTPPRLLQQANVEQLTGYFLQDYLPVGSGGATFDSWVETLPEMHTGETLAHQALTAISLCTAGRRSSDRALMQKGLDLYGMALQQTSHAVQDPRLSRSTSVMAAIKTFGLIEVSIMVHIASSRLYMC